MYEHRSSHGAPSATYNHLTSPTGEPTPNIFRETASIADLRRQQEAFHQVREKLDRENGWMLAPVAAPLVAPFIAESLAARFAGGAAVAISRAGPLKLSRDGISNIKGENIYARVGRAEHDALKRRLANKQGWEYEPKIGESGLRPDVGAPIRNAAKPEQQKLMDLKPNTPSGRKAGARDVRLYQDVLERKTRAIFYDQAAALRRLK